MNRRGFLAALAAAVVPAFASRLPVRIPRKPPGREVSGASLRALANWGPTYADRVRVFELCTLPNPHFVVIESRALPWDAPAISREMLGLQRWYNQAQSINAEYALDFER